MKRHPTRILLLAALAACVALAPGEAFGRIVCWTNKQGVRECGNSVPPEYSQEQTETKNQEGLTIKTKERAKTKAELEAEKKSREQAQEKARLAAQQAEKDRVLLATFTTEQDLVLARDGKLQAIDVRVRHSEQLVKRLEQELTGLQEDAARQERAGKKVSSDTKDSIDQAQQRIDEQRKFIADREREKVALRKRFDADLARYRELKAKQSASQ